MKRVIRAATHPEGLGEWSKFYRFATAHDLNNLGYTSEDLKLPNNCITYVIAKTPELEDIMNEYSFGCLYEKSDGTFGVKIPFGRRGYMAIKPTLLEDLFGDKI